MMKIQQPKEDCNDSGPPLLISYKTNPTISKTSADKSDYLKFDINTKPGERDRNMVAIKVPLFWTGSPEDFLKLVTILNKIIWGQDL